MAERKRHTTETRRRWRCFECSDNSWHPGGLEELKKHRARYHLDKWPQYSRLP